MKRILLLNLIVGFSAFAMEKENPVHVQQVKKQDSEKDAKAVSISSDKQPVATSSSNSTESKKVFFARCFACCNGKAEAK